MSTSTQEQISTLERIEIDLAAKPSEPGDHDKFSHYIRKTQWEEAYGGEVATAICGKRWVPSSDPKRHPVCPTCKDIYEGLNPGPDGSE